MATNSVVALTSTPTSIFSGTGSVLLIRSFDKIVYLGGSGVTPGTGLVLKPQSVLVLPNVTDTIYACCSVLDGSTGIAVLAMASASATGTVVGPGTSTNNAVALFSGTGGQTLKNSVVTIGATGLVSGVLDPVSAQDAATKNYADTGAAARAPIASVAQVVTAVKTGNYNAALGELVRCDTTSAGFTVTLPTAASQSGKRIMVKRVAGANLLTIATTSAQTINGQAASVYNIPADASLESNGVGFTSDGTNWIADAMLSVGSSTPAALTAGASAVAGTSLEAARLDHGHDTTLLAPRDYTLNNQTGTTYAPVLTDAGKLVTLNNASAITVTFPANASVAFPIGTIIAFCQIGAGQVTFAITSDTLNQPGLTLKTRAQWSRVTAEKITSTIWVLSGDLAVV